MSKKINRHELNSNNQSKIFNYVNELGREINKPNEPMGKGFNIL